MIPKGHSKKDRSRMVLILRREFKQKGLPMKLAVDHAIRIGLRRHVAIRVAREAYGVDPPRRIVKIVQGGRVSPK